MKIDEVKPHDIVSVVADYMGGESGIAHYERPRSWDFCYNYFRDHERVTSNPEKSSLQLGYYLASWGMLRGGTYLLSSTNARHYLKVLEVIEKHNDGMRSVTPADYTSRATQQYLVSVFKDLGDALVPDGNRRMTVVTKTMMGVWGVFPALDTLFLKTFQDFRRAANERGVFTTFRERSVSFIGEFYETHQQTIDSLSALYTTVAFDTNESSGIPLPPAKIIDIYGFNAGRYTGGRQTLVQ